MKSTFIQKVIYTVLVGLVVGSFMTPAALAQTNTSTRLKTVTVTVNVEGNATVDPKDFMVYEDKIQQTVVSAIPASSEAAPLNLAIVMETALPQINVELQRLRTFVRELPAGSRVMVGYVWGNYLTVQQPFSDDLDAVAASMHVVPATQNGVWSPYLPLMDVLKKFNGLPEGRNEVLFISNGFDPFNGSFSSPSSNLYLDRAVRQAQRSNVTIHTVFSPAPYVRRFNAVLAGQSALAYVAEETGGQAYIGTRTGFVTFDSPLKNLSNALTNQYVITYQSTNLDKKFHKVEVKTDFSNVKVSVLKGYSVK